LKNDFVDLLRFSCPPTLYVDEADAITEIEVYLDTPQANRGTNYDIIPIDRVLYLRERFKHNETMIKRVDELFMKLATVYESRQRLLHRIQLQGYNPSKELKENGDIHFCD
jgi:hypothetical protein